MALVPFQRSNSSVPSSSSSSFSFQTCPPQWTYDVFLSFRGEDTRDNFISHLYKELVRRGIETFIDDQELETGEKIKPELLKAIEKSRFSIVVISKSYASSRWCLEELVKILECKNERAQKVYPIFFHVNPSEVRKQTGIFGKDFDELGSKHEIAEVQSWREALKEVGNLSGLAYPNAAIGFESKLIEEIVGKIFDYFNHVYTSVDKGLVGMDSHLKKVIELLGNNDSHVFGIWGMGGIGKTTIAKVVYDRISWQFDGYCFIENVRAVSKEHGVMFLQEQLISGILKEKQKVNSLSSGKNMIKRILSHKKILIVLDDVDESIELENLLGEDDWLSSGSIIIITSRNLHVLKTCGAISPYKVCELEKDEAVKLFKSKAFRKGEQLGEGYGNLLDRAVEYCKGVPLALIVLGSCLRGRKKTYWKCALKELNWKCASTGLKFSPLLDVEKVFNVFEISYNALGLEEREIFLDIAFFFKQKNINDAIKILKSYTVHPKPRIKLLVEKSLITISSEGQLIMHDLIQEMGRNIVRRESIEEPGQRSRLCLYKDIQHVLMNNMGTDTVKGIVMEYPNFRNYDLEDFEFLKELKFNSKAFEKLRNLRILKICCFHLSGDLKDLSNNLRYIEWCGYPLRRMPSKFQPMQLVELRITHSKIEQLWMGTEVLYNLRIVDLSQSKYLTMIPDFGWAPNLERLDLSNCKNLRSIPNNIGQLKALQHVELFMCSKLEKLPEEVGDLNCLKYLGAISIHIRQIPSSICRLNSLIKLHLCGSDFESLPSSMNQLSRLKKICFGYCPRLQELPKLSSNIHDVNAHFCTSLRTIVSPSIYKDIENFYFFNCSKLVENKESNIMTDKFLLNQFQGSRNREKFKFQIVFPGSDIPEWINHQRNESSICLELPPHWFNSRFLGIAFACVVIGHYNPIETHIYDMHHKEKSLFTILWFESHMGSTGTCKTVGVYYIPRNRLSRYQAQEGGFTFTFELSQDKDRMIEKCGARLVYKDDVEGNNDQALSIYNSPIISSHDNDNNLVVFQGVEEDINIKRPRLEQEFNTSAAPPVKGGGRKKLKSSQKRKILSPKKKNMKLMWMSTWHKQVTWIQNNQPIRRKDGGLVSAIS